MNSKFKLCISVFSIVSMITTMFFFSVISGNDSNAFLFFNFDDDNSKKSEASSQDSLPRPVPKKSEFSQLMLNVSDYGTVKAKTKSIDKNFSIINNNKSDVDLSKLKVRYYYTDESKSEQIFRCDSAIITYCHEPYYENVDEYVQGTITKKSDASDESLHYLDITIDKKDGLLASMDRINIFVRVYNKNRSYYNQADDYSYYDDSCVVLYYNDEIASGNELR